MRPVSGTAVAFGWAGLALEAACFAMAVPHHLRGSLSRGMIGWDACFFHWAFLTGFMSMALLMAQTPTAEGFAETLSRLLGGCVDLLALPLLLIAGVFLASSVILLSREGLQKRSLLGMGLSLAWLAAWAAHGLLGGPARENRAVMLGRAALDWAVVGGSLTLLLLFAFGLMACGRRPAHDKDYIVILGCQIRRDGGVTPLLRGRLDCAVRFGREQAVDTGKRAVFIPSGGQGSNECVPEARAMAEYLRSQGVEEDRILEEDRSTSTEQNLVYAMEKAGKGPGEARYAVATNDFHVLRSVLKAGQLGMDAEGIGSPSLWYFFLNAYLREAVGLLAMCPVIPLCALSGLLLFQLLGLASFL